MTNAKIITWHCWIGCCAVALVAQTKLLFGIASAPGPMETFAFFGAGCAYALSRHEPLPRWFTSLMALGTAMCFALLTPQQQLAATVPAAIWLLYNGLSNRVSLRGIPSTKPLAVAVAWSWFTVVLPLPSELWTNAFVPALGRGAFVYALAIATDLCDLEYDAQSGLKTLAAQLGSRNTLVLMYTALAVSAICVWLNWTFQRYHGIQVLALECSLVLAAAAITFAVRSVRSIHVQKVLIDATVILQFALVWSIPALVASHRAA